jgi:hypothetical protein
MKIGKVKDSRKILFSTTIDRLDKVDRIQITDLTTAGKAVDRVGLLIDLHTRLAILMKRTTQHAVTIHFKTVMRKHRQYGELRFDLLDGHMKKRFWDFFSFN